MVVVNIMVYKRIYLMRDHVTYAWIFILMYMYIYMYVSQVTLTQTGVVTNICRPGNSKEPQTLNPWNVLSVRLAECWWCASTWLHLEQGWRWLSPREGRTTPMRQWSLPKNVAQYFKKKSARSKIVSLYRFNRHNTTAPTAVLPHLANNSVNSHRHWLGLQRRPRFARDSFRGVHSKCGLHSTLFKPLSQTVW